MLRSSLDLFHESTKKWFVNTLGNPTKVQEEAWPKIANGNHTLVSAPTGTGKTLTAFLVFIDRLLEQARAKSLKQELQLIYISPLKSLAGDIRENLKRPLEGILMEEYDTNHPSLTNLTIGIRTGDTTQKERRQMIKTPPHILITTPESLYLMLTSKSGQTILKTAKAVIIDELHALIDSKRGAHMMLSIARLDRLCGESLQRIGLSATIKPLGIAAEYLSPDPVSMIAPKMKKEIEIKITSPIADYKIMMRNPIWEELANTVYSYCKDTKSAIAFVEGRAYAEKLAYFINQLGGENFARTHHGSLSKEQRFEVEYALRSGTLKLLCATSSMELGIDVGDIDQVFQIGCPRSISSTMQRLGRAGHKPNHTSVMHMFPREAIEGLYCGLTAEVARAGRIEHSKPPRLCYDILAQHLVSMACGGEYKVDDVMKVLSRAYPFREVTEEDVKEVLGMLAGDYEHKRDIPARPRIIYDRIHGHVIGDNYSRMLAVSAAGTIPDKGLYTCKTENGVKLGELDEEFVYETRVGDRFLLGTFAWRIVNISKDTVVVTGTNTASARLPFWHGDIKGRKLGTGIAFGEIFSRLNKADESNSILMELNKLGLDEISGRSALELLKQQLLSTGILPDHKTIIMEHFKDENNNYQMMVHSIFGRQVNEPLSILVKEAAGHHLETTINCVTDDDGFLFFPYDGNPLPEGLLNEISLTNARQIIEAVLPTTPLYNMNFRYNTARALLMGVRGNGRQPLWIQRMKSAELLSSLVEHENHPMIRETKRECLEDYWDLGGLEQILLGIKTGEIKVIEMYLETPSPMSLTLRRQTEASMMYDYAPTPSNIYQATNEALKEVTMIKPGIEQLNLLSTRKKLPENSIELHSLLMIEGDVIALELDIPIEWLEELALRGSAKYIEPGLWIAAEQEQEYRDALVEEIPEAKMGIVKRLLRYRGAKSYEQIAERYLWTDEVALQVLGLLLEQEKVVEDEEVYYHAEIYDRARHETIRNRRRQITTLPAARYAALLTNTIQITASPLEQLRHTLFALIDQQVAVDNLEQVILPSRVKNYRMELMDAVLSDGSIFWQLNTHLELCFHRTEDIDWDADMTDILNSLEGNEKIIYGALLKMGASFMQRLNGLVEGSPYDTLLGLAIKGLISADSFLLLKQCTQLDKLKISNVRTRINARAKLLSTGRFEVIRPLKILTMDELLHRNFDRVPILCRETIKGVAWGTALETLRIWEYTGQVRRGYFIEGLSGIQFIREKDYETIIMKLANPREQIIWINAIDPLQPWGKALQHLPDRKFQNIAGTTVALRAGVPVAVMERLGKKLRVFEGAYLDEALTVFQEEFNKRRILSGQNRIVMKEYPIEAVPLLEKTGFIHEIQDYVLYRT